MEKLQSLVSGKLADYLVVTELPSGFRSYPKEIDKVYIRGIYFDETVSVSRFMEDPQNYEQLIAIYSDVIRFPSSSFTLYDLELCDFMSLIAGSSVLSSRNHAWATGFNCSDKECKGRITSPVILDDFDFIPPTVSTLPIPFTISDSVVNVSPLAMRDLITLEKTEISLQSVMSYALLIKGSDLSIEQKVDLIKYAAPYEVEDLMKIDQELEITNRPIIKLCPVCKKPLRLNIQLTELKPYP